ncbi:Transposon TX1 uncharacterized 149 kDa protein [Linum perenne]
MITGDFNAIRSSAEASNGSVGGSSSREFNDWINSNNFVDHRVCGEWFTWMNNQDGKPISRRLDRVLVNQEWMLKFGKSRVTTTLPHLSDHCGIMTETDTSIGRVPSAFKFFNYWTKHPDYEKLIKDNWRDGRKDHYMEDLYSNLKRVKEALKRLNKDSFSDISKRVQVAEQSMVDAQKEALKMNDSKSFKDLKVATANWDKIKSMEEMFYKQKSRSISITEGDSNTKYFYNKVKYQNARKQIALLVSEEGESFREIDDISKEAVNFYQKLLGKEDNAVRDLPQEYFDSLIINKLTEEDKEVLSKEVTYEEVRNALFGMQGDRSPGPDGFNAYFFQKGWHIVGTLLAQAVQEFFTSCRLSPQVNSTILALIPKIPSACRMVDFRPIACCNTVYKCITKVLTNRLRDVLPYLISNSQSAFIKGRVIADNIMLAQDLISQYQNKRISPRCVLKVDLQKAFDSISWKALIKILHAMRFPDVMIDWITECLHTAKLSVCINGGSFGYFDARKGLRQGDPLSPLLFVIVMEVLHCLSSRGASAGYVPLHPRCRKMGITHLCFADDLLFFTNGTAFGVQQVLGTLNAFYAVTGLGVNPMKSSLFCSASIQAAEKERMKAATGFRIESLPVTYLGVPLISSKLRAVDCKKLVEKITKRISGWQANILSQAGKLQLVKDVINSMTTYWMNIFNLPQGVIKDIEKKCSDFLWGVSPNGAKKARVAWKTVAKPYDEGGANAIQLKIWNTVCIARSVWSLLLRSGSLWVAWLSSNRLKRQDFWCYRCTANDSWMWKSIIICRDVIMPFITQDLERTWLWDGEPMQRFSAKRVLQSIRGAGDKVTWSDLVWKKPTIPKYSFMSWQMCINRLPFNDILLKWGIDVQPDCFLCTSGEDSRDHTIGKCDYVCWIKKQIFKEFKSFADWDNEVSWFVKRAESSVWEGLVWRIIVSNVWKERCCRAYGSEKMSADALLSRIQLEMGLMWSKTKNRKAVLP